MVSASPSSNSAAFLATCVCPLDANRVHRHASLHPAIILGARRGWVVWDRRGVDRYFQPTSIAQTSILIASSSSPIPISPQPPNCWSTLLQCEASCLMHLRVHTLQQVYDAMGAGSFQVFPGHPSGSSGDPDTPIRVPCMPKLRTLPWKTCTLRQALCISLRDTVYLMIM